MNEHQTDSVHGEEQTPATQPAVEAVTALTDEELEQASGGFEGIYCSICGANSVTSSLVIRKEVPL